VTPARPGEFRVLIVEDSPPVAVAIRDYVRRIDGFRWVGSARTAAEARALLERTAVDVVLLDVLLPDESGLNVCRTSRGAGSTVDFIAITSVRNLEAVRAAMAYGVAYYILKPFTFTTLRERLLTYARRQSELAAAPVQRQSDVDRLISVGAERAWQHPLPVNLSRVTLAAVREQLHRLGQGGASEIADAVGVSRSTARRYLEHLVDAGQADQTLQYGRTGRPQVIYRHRTG
jgi:response regulator of citrate/malate metabolism